jgi:hypothetical protein
MNTSKIERTPTSYKADPHMTSVVSYPHRCSAWGDSRYRGNCDGSLFKELVLRYKPKRVGDPMLGSGTTRDVIAGLNRHTGTRIRFWGSDLRDGFNLLRQDPPGRFDLIWVHPPYWNIVRYSDHPDDLSTIASYEEFLASLTVCLIRCACALEPGGRLAVLMGDVRRQGAYYPIVRDILNLEGLIGELRSIIIKVQHNCWSDRVSYASYADVPIQHEYCTVFEGLGG